MRVAANPFSVKTLRAASKITFSVLLSLVLTTLFNNLVKLICYISEMFLTLQMADWLAGLLALNYPLGLHGFSHLKEASDVGARHIIAGFAIRLGRSQAGVVDIFHDADQLRVHFFARPALPHVILSHLQA